MCGVSVNDVLCLEIVVQYSLLCFGDCACLYYLVKRSNLGHNFFFLNLFIALLTMFRSTMCPPSGENTVPM
jgi:hypothetical protein